MTYPKGFVSSRYNHAPAIAQSRLTVPVEMANVSAISSSPSSTKNRISRISLFWNPKTLVLQVLRREPTNQPTVRRWPQRPNPVLSASALPSAFGLEPLSHGRSVHVPTSETQSQKNVHDSANLSCHYRRVA